MTSHQAQLFRQLSEHVTVLLHEQPEPAESEAARLRARGIALVPGQVRGLEVVDDRLRGVRLACGALVECDALVVAPVVRARVEFLAPLGLLPEDVEMNGSTIGSAVPAEPTGATSVPGVFAIGNATDVSAQVVVSAAAGLRAGAMLNADLVEEEIRLALASAEQAA
jgi:thioredoxin reductase